MSSSITYCTDINRCKIGTINNNYGYSEGSLKKIRYNLNRPVEEFYDREDVLEEVKSTLKKKKVIVICGMGGVGKTQLSRYFVKKYEDYFNHIVWIDSETKDSGEECFRDLAKQLNISTKNDDNRVLPLKLIVNNIHRLLVSDVQSTNVNEDGFIKCPLFIFDNAEKKSDFSFLLPNKDKSYVIITTQNTHWGNLSVYKLAVFSVKQSVIFVSDNLKKNRNGVPNNLIEQLVNWVGCLPLCLHQACSYINEETEEYGQSVEDAILEYISNFENDPKKFVSHTSEYFDIPYEKTLFITISNIIDKLKGIDDGKESVEILYHMSFLNPNYIEENYFAGFNKRSIIYLQKYSLVSVSARNYYSIHRLTQLLVRKIVFEDKDFISLITKTVKLSYDGIQFHKNDMNNYLKKYTLSIYDVFLNKILGVNYKNRFGSTPIFYAIGDNNIEKTEMLINNGADINVINNCQHHLLHLSAQFAGTEIIKLLLKNEFDVNIKDKWGNTPLMRAAHGNKIENMKLLLNSGADINIINNNQQNLLHASSGYAGTEMINLLLQNEFNVNVKDKFGETPLMHAVYGAKIENVKLLLNSGADINVINNCQQNLLHVSPQYTGTEMINLLLEHEFNVNVKDNHGCTPLMHAVFGDKMENVKLLLNSGADINVINNCQQNLLHMSAQYTGTEMINLLLKHEFDVNVKDNHGYTPLMHAVFGDKIENVKLLLNSGAEINVIDNNQQNLLHASSRCAGVEMINLLLQNEFNVNVKDTFGDTPLMHAVRGDKIENVKLLRNSGADINTINNCQQNLLHVSAQYAGTEMINLLLKHEFDVNVKDNHGYTPLMCAVQADKIENVKFLLNYGSDINVIDNNKCNLLHASAQFGGTEMINLLLKYELNVNVRDNDGDTPLLCAVLEDKIENVEFLLNSGADVNVVNNEGYDALKLSIKMNNKEIHNLLENRHSVN